jgi:hypothetical protein
MPASQFESEHWGYPAFATGGPKGAPSNNVKIPYTLQLYDKRSGQPLLSHPFWDLRDTDNEITRLGLMAFKQQIGVRKYYEVCFDFKNTGRTTVKDLSIRISSNLIELGLTPDPGSETFRPTLHPDQGSNLALPVYADLQHGLPSAVGFQLRLRYKDFLDRPKEENLKLSYYPDKDWWAFGPPDEASPAVLRQVMITNQ